MSPADLAIGGTLGAAVVGLAVAALKALAGRTVAQADGQIAELRADVKQILLELRTTVAHSEALRDRIDRIESRCTNHLRDNQ